MKLTELDGRFIEHTGDGSFRVVPTLRAAHGLMFVCPKCAHERGSLIGAHSVICWFRDKVDESVSPGPGRWTPEGAGLADVTFVAGLPPKAVSVQLTGGCNWHGFIRRGEATLS